MKLSDAAFPTGETLHTNREILDQPALWKTTEEKFWGESGRLRPFFEQALEQADQVILTGAGTSSFIGLSLLGTYFSRTGKIVRALSTTDLVSHPRDYFNAGQAPLIISFARSGNSPESCASLQLADQLCGKCFHLIITCSEDGELAHYQSPNPTFVFVLPPEANDKGLAMTGSYTSMLLTALLLAHAAEKEFCRTQVRLLTAAAEKILTYGQDIISQVAEKKFNRAVFLGSGPLFGTASEAALKLQELTDGQIVCKSDSFLGFRHGPKAVVDNSTLVVYFFSSDPYVRQYEMDLLHAMKTGNSALFHLAIAEDEIDDPCIDAAISMSTGSGALAESFMTVCGILPAQLLALFKSIGLGLMPDNPSVNGAISRVVEGVKIYSLTI